MRILHTSDWHLGRTFESYDLEADQDAFVAWLCGVVTDQEVDVVVVAGDVWDRSNPKAEAVALMERSLNAVARAGAQVLCIAGNHDSATRLSYGASWAKDHGITLVTEDVDYPAPVVLEVRGERVGVVAVPYRDPQRTVAPLPGPNGEHRLRTHEHVLADALAEGKRHLIGEEVCATIAVAHAYVAGSETSDSERRYVGGADQVSTSIFEGFDAVLLGHLHRPQTFDGGRIAYSGSPLPYSFSETTRKVVRILDLGADGSIETSEVEIPVGVAFGKRVATLTGTLADLIANPDFDPAEGCFVAAKLTDETLQLDAKATLATRFPYVVNVSRSVTGRASGAGPRTPTASVVEQEPLEVVAAFLAEVYGREVGEEERALLTDVIDRVVLGGAK